MMDVAWQKTTQNGIGNSSNMDISCQALFSLIFEKTYHSDVICVVSCISHRKDLHKMLKKSCSNCARNKWFLENE